MFYLTINTEPNFPLPISFPFLKSLSLRGYGAFVVWLLALESKRWNVLGPSEIEWKVECVETVSLSSFSFLKAVFAVLGGLCWMGVFCGSLSLTLILESSETWCMLVLAGYAGSSIISILKLTGSEKRGCLFGGGVGLLALLVIVRPEVFIPWLWIGSVLLRCRPCSLIGPGSWVMDLLVKWASPSWLEYFLSCGFCPVEPTDFSSGDINLWVGGPLWFCWTFVDWLSSFLEVFCYPAFIPFMVLIGWPNLSASLCWMRYFAFVRLA